MKLPRHTHQYRTFTLIEMLVVIAIIGIIASFLLPSLQNAMGTSYQIKCLSNCRQISILLNSYMNDNEGYQPKPYLQIQSSPKFCHRWYQALNPYIEKAVPTSGTTASSDVFKCDILPGQSGYTRATADYCLTSYSGYDIYNDWVKPLNLVKSPGKTSQFYDGGIFKTWLWAGTERYEVQLYGRFYTSLPEDKRATDWRHGASDFGPAYYGSYSKGYDGRCNFSFLDGHAETFSNLLTSTEASQMHALK